MPKKSNVSAPDDATGMLKTMTAAKRMEAVKDGRIEVALAIAGTTQLVKVDPTSHPFTTVPANLFDRQFNDQKVAINDAQMAVFKANLTLLLPEIKADIAKIPESSNLVIEDVAELVRLSLLAIGGQ